MDPKWFEQHGITDGKRELLANMGIYLFNRDYLLDLMRNTDDEDFGKGVFPKAVQNRHVHMHMFEGYWEDIGTVRAFFEANIAMAASNPPFQLTSAEAPLYSRARFLPPSRIRGATITDSLIADGCDISPGSMIENSVIGVRCAIGENVTIRNSIIFGNDAPVAQCATSIAAGSVIEGTIVDKNAIIGVNSRIVNQDAVQDTDDIGGCMIRDGIPVVLKDAVLPDNWDLTAAISAASK